MRVLVATFSDGDAERTLLAMRSLPYDRLVLIGEDGEDEPEGLSEIRRLESLAGQEVLLERVGTSDFMELVDDISDLVSRLGKTNGRANDLVLNISGGTKLMADAALFAAFRMGVPAYHVTDRVVRLPIMKGVTARSRFTPLQTQLVRALESPCTLPELGARLGQQSKQSLERVMRELRRMGLVSAKLESGQVALSLTSEGHEVRRALAASNGTSGR